MRRKYLTILFLLIAALAVSGYPTTAQEPGSSTRAEDIALTETPPIDPLIAVGRLANGLRYYIRENKMPENRAELRLVVNVGSILEDADQQGLAHFVEHMAFNGTRHFAKKELVEFMESIGMRFGPELNAYTGFDETVYMLTIPTDSPEIMEKAILILEDWAHGLLLENEEIDKERGVIVEEWRLGQGAGARLRDQQFPVLLKGSRYADRLPIGKKEILESFEHAALKRFYRDWYRPDLMAVVAVGDFDSAHIEAQLKEHFKNLEMPLNPRPRKDFLVPDHAETLFSIATDKEIPYTNVTVYNKLPTPDQSTVGAYRQTIVERLYSAMLNRRFSELTQKAEPPFIYAFSNRGALVRTKDSYMLTASVEERGITKGLKAVFLEAERVTRYGFTTPEFERQKQDMLRSLEQAYTERDKQDSGMYAAEYIRNFLQGEPIPGIEYEFKLYKRFVPQITLGEINRIGQNWNVANNRVIVVSAPEKEDLIIPGEQELLMVLNSMADAEVAAYEDNVSDEPLLAQFPDPGSISDAFFREDLNITEWKLSNGVHVVIQPTDFKKDEIVFRAFSPGGTSLASDSDFIPAQTAAQVISSSGLSQFSALDLQKKLAGKVALARPYIGQLEEGLSGSASPQDLETLFQLIHLTFTSPRADSAVFQSLQSRMKAQLANRNAMPEVNFFETLQRILSQNHPRARSMTVESVEAMDLEKSLAFYKDRFADSSDFTFVFVGSIDLEILEPLVERYLASLPSIPRKENWRDLGIRPPKGVIKDAVNKGKEPKSMVAIAFTGPFQYDLEHRNELRALCTIMDTRLRNALREDRGGTYGVGIRPSYNRIPHQDFSIMINFGTDPERAEELTRVVFDEIEKIKTRGPLQEELGNIIEAEVRSFETSSQQNNWWLNQLAYRYQAGEDPGDLLSFKDSLDKLTLEAIQEAAKKYFDLENYVQLTLFPEKQK